MDENSDMEDLLLKLVYCEGLSIVGKWKVLKVALKLEYTKFSVEELVKITNYQGKKGILQTSWQGLQLEELKEKLSHQKALSFYSSDYPETLKNSHYPPLFLFYEGNINWLNYPSLAVVGARDATPYANQVLQRIVPRLVEKNQVIVSGLAKGVDRFSHELALRSGGKTIGVIGCGLDICYPREVSDLFLEMKQNHLVLSEYPLNTPIKRHHFPMRNRIIAGISDGTCVIEAKERSGSLITAQLALEAGKEVFAIPGEILSGQSNGCHHLIQDGAKCVYRMEDILEDLPKY